MIENNENNNQQEEAKKVTGAGHSPACDGYVDDSQKLKLIEELINETGHCMCGTFESCDYCGVYSPLNRLRDKIRGIIHVNERKMSAKAYGESITINIKI